MIRPEPHPMNNERSRWAEVALWAFAEKVGATPEDFDTALHDLICDLAHLAEREALDVVEVFSAALATWAIERADPVGLERPPQVTIEIAPIKLAKPGQRRTSIKRRRS